MKVMNWERIFIISTSVTLNKVFLFWLIRSNTLMMMAGAFTLFALNFVILAKSVDKLIEIYENSKKKRARSEINVI